MRSLTEIQRFRDNPFIFWGLMAALAIPLILVAVEIGQLRNIGNDEWGGLAFTGGALLLSGLLLATMKTHLRLETDKILYRSNPFMAKRKSLRLDELAEFYVSSHKWVHGLGYKITMNGGRVYVLKPGKVLVIKTKDGRSYRFGINRPGLVKRFMKENWERNEKSYGQ